MGIWTGRRLLPKLKLFLWRCAHNALPVKEVLSIRIQTVSSECQLCKAHPETVRHALFDCTFVRGCWASSGLGLRPDNLPGTFRKVFQAIQRPLSEEGLYCLVCSTWAIWRLRNDAILGGKYQSLQTFNRYYAQTREACQTLYYAAPISTKQQQVCYNGQQPNLELVPDIAYYVDGSWSDDGKAGVGLYLTIGGEPARWVSKMVRAINSAQTEARGVLEAFLLLQQLNLQGGLIFSDSKETVDSLSHNQPIVHDWRAFDHIWSSWAIYNQTVKRFKVAYLSRNDPSIQVAHSLANQGRLNGWAKEGTGMPGGIRIEELEN